MCEEKPIRMKGTDQAPVIEVVEAVLSPNPSGGEECIAQAPVSEVAYQAITGSKPSPQSQQIKVDAQK